MSDAFDKREAAYEAEYFHKKDREMVEKLRAVFHQKVDKQGIAEATGITDDQVLDNLVKLNLRGDMMAAFQLYPLVAVAWADGKVDENERLAVLNAAQEQGIARSRLVAFKLGDLVIPVREGPCRIFHNTIQGQKFGYN